MSRGAIGGSAGEGGTEYRRGVAAYAVAYGLAGLALQGFGVPPEQAHIASVLLETDDPVDDIAVHFTSGWTTYIQAKRALARQQTLKEAAAQWRAAAAGDLDPRRHRLVVATGSLSRDMRRLAKILERHKRAHPGSLDEREQELLDHLKSHLAPLSATQIDNVLKCAAIIELDVEEVERPGAREAISVLAQTITADSAISPVRAWELLRSDMGRLARFRAGDDLAGWIEVLRDAGVTFRADSHTPVGIAARTHEALARYRARLTAEGSVLELRALGAEFPALSLLDADADIRVHAEGEDESRDGKDPLWAFLRRGRAVLTGLPGAGKSTSVRMLAARLCQLEVAPLPIRVSLKDVDNRDRTQPFRDRLLDVAVSEDRPDDRVSIRAELNRRLDTGGVALLLDSLDETYERCGHVVVAIEKMLQQVSGDVDVLLVTRDIGWGQAKTFGWPTLIQSKPANAEAVVAAVLEAADKQKAAQQGQPSTSASPSGEAARSWIRSALAATPILSETPLMPVLLALLAGETHREHLPTSRAATLVEIVHDVVRRYELTRRRDVPLGVLKPTQLPHALMHAFAVDGATILEHRGVAPERVVLQRVAREVTEYWNLGHGDARVVAQDAIRFFDECGIFVSTGRPASIAPRVALFAEIGSALYVVEHTSTDLNGWVRDHVRLGQLEAPVLAAALSTSAAAAFGAVAVESDDPTTLRAAVRAQREGAQFPDDQLHDLVIGLLEHFSDGKADGWECFDEILQLPIPATLRDAIQSAASAYDKSRQLFVRAALDLGLRSADENRTDPDQLRQLLGLGSLDKLADEHTGMFSLRELRHDRQLHRLQVAAADLLVGHDAAATEQVVRLAAIDAGEYDPFREILRRRNVPYTMHSSSIDDAPGTAWRILDTLPRDSHVLMLDALIATEPPDTSVRLTYGQQMRLDELATFLETLDMNAGGSHHMFKHPGEVPKVIALFSSLYEFDTAMLAAQARIVRDRVADETFGAMAYYALFEGADAPTAPADWSKVEDGEDALGTLRSMMTWGLPHAEAAANALWHCRSGPLSEAAVAMLRRLLKTVWSSPRHVEVVVHTLNSVTRGRENPALAVHDDPAVRAPAARWFDLAPAGRLRDAHVKLIEDVDGYVRESALNQAVKLEPSNLKEILVQAAAQPDPNWVCRHCRTENKPHATSCVSPRCYGTGPAPAKLAARLLADMESKP